MRMTCWKAIVRIQRRTGRQKHTECILPIFEEEEVIAVRVMARYCPSSHRVRLQIGFLDLHGFLAMRGPTNAKRFYNRSGDIRVNLGNKNFKQY